MAKDARDAIRQVFAAAGYQPHQIAGVLGHAERESSFNTGAVGDNGKSVGLFQWQGPRLKALKQFAAEAGADFRDPTTQAQFAVNELSSSEQGAGKALQNARTPQEASIAMNRFERFSHNGGWKNANGGESRARQEASLKYADPNMNVAAKEATPFDQATQSVTDHMNKSAEGKSLQKDYASKNSSAPLEKEIAQAVAQNDQVASYVPKEPGKMVRSSDTSGTYNADDGDAAQAAQKPFQSIRHPNQHPNIENSPDVLKEAPLDYGPDKNDPEKDQGNNLVQQASMRIPRPEGTPRWKARAAERAERDAGPAPDIKPEAPKPEKTTTEDDIIRQILREEQLGREVEGATGLTPNGQPVTPEQAFNPNPISKTAASLAGGAVPLAVAASDQGDQRGPIPSAQGFGDDPALKAVQEVVGAKPAANSSQDRTLRDILGQLGDTVLPAVQHAARNDPQVMPAADVVAKSVVRSMAANDSQHGGGVATSDGGYYQRLASQAGYAGDSQEMMRAVQQDQAGLAPPGQMPMQQTQQIPLPQPKPQDIPIDVSSFINGGGFEVG